MNITRTFRLIDVHTHLGMVVSDETVSVEDQYPGATYALYVAQRIAECLMSGFTTVRDAGMTDWSFKLAVERIKIIFNGLCWPRGEF